MGRDEFMEVLMRVRRIESLDELRETIEPLQKALFSIQRKRSHFLEDACAAVVRQCFSLIHSSERAITNSDDEDDEHAQFEEPTDQSMEATTAFSLCLVFGESVVAQLPAREDKEDADVLRQRAVLVAYFLHLLSREELLVDSDVCVAIAAALMRCGLDLHLIVWTLRFREELAMFRKMMMPEAEQDESGDGKDDGEDDSWIVHELASTAGLSATLEYFFKQSGHEYAFASWSNIGIVRLVSLLASSPNEPSFEVAVVPVVSPYSNLFAMAAVVQVLLQGQTMELKRQGLVVLKSSLDKCAPDGLALLTDDADPDDSDSEHHDPHQQMPSFEDTSTSFYNRDWISPLIELTTNAMVSFPEATDRAMSLMVFRQLVQIVETDARFSLIRELALRCPYGNVAAILIDQLRSDTVRAWADPILSSPSSSAFSPYRSPSLAKLIADLLQLLSERDLKLHADLLASVASLIRFVVIRDKENDVGLRTPATLTATKDALQRIRSRLRSTLAEAEPTASHDHVHGENLRFVVVEAALDSTISLLEN